MSALAPAFRRSTLHRFLLIGAPVGWIGAVLLHPSASPSLFYTDLCLRGLSRSADRWLFVHFAQLALTLALGAALWVAVSGRKGLAPTITRVAAPVYLVFFSAFDSVAGIASGLAVRHARSLSGGELDGAFRRAEVPAAGNHMAGDLTPVRQLAARFGSKVVVAAGLATVAVGMLLILRLGTGSGYGAVLASLVVWRPAWGSPWHRQRSDQGSTSTAQAGVGSAVNDTTREIGGALGVAVLGSVLSSVFGSRMIDVLAGTPLPDEARHAAEHSVTGAVVVAHHIGGPQGDALAHAAKAAFVDGLHATSLVAAGFATAGALIALAFLPAEAADSI